MKRYDFVGIKTQSIYGIRNPNLVVVGTTEKPNCDFKVIADGKEIPFTLNRLEDNGFSINAKLNKNDKVIKVIMIVGKDKYTIVDINNKLSGRIKRKISSVLKKVWTVLKAVFVTLGKGICFFWKEYHFLVPPKLWPKYWRDFKARVKARSGNVIFYNPYDKKEYNLWLKNNEVIEEPDLSKLKYKPLISILIPTYNIGEAYLNECIDSVLNQSYDNFEICIADDASKNKETLDTLKKLEKKDKRIKIKYRKENGHISKATNDALSLAKGEFIALLDDDDVLSPNALYEMVKALNENKKLDFVYSDEDKLDVDGVRCDPNFKPDWSPDTLLSLNYICHFTMIRKSLVEEVGGFEPGLEGAQDYDLFLKCTEKTENIYHIPKILYHWRKVEGSTSMTMSNKNYALERGKKAIENALKRRKINGIVEIDEKSLYYKVIYKYDKEPLISIIIPTRDYMDITKQCVDSIYDKTTYKNFEIIIANNQSKEKETLDFFDEYKKKHDNFRVVDCNINFNYSKINNMAIKKAKGEYIVLLNNDTEVITPEWLSIMVGYAMQKHVGAVGVKLLYPDDKTVQHGGVILGLGGVASHAYIGAKRDDFGIFGRLRVPYDYAANTAACLMVSKKKYDEVGGLEEKLEVAYNDIDFNIKLLKAGYYNVFLPNVELLHYESKSRGLDTTGAKYQRFLVESDYMYKKWDKYINNDPFYNPNFSKKGWFVLDRKKKNTSEK